jgi:hypothetical protein
LEMERELEKARMPPKAVPPEPRHFLLLTCRASGKGEAQNAIHLPERPFSQSRATPQGTSATLPTRIEPVGTHSGPGTTAMRVMSLTHNSLSDTTPIDKMNRNRPQAEAPKAPKAKATKAGSKAGLHTKAEDFVTQVQQRFIKTPQR